MDAGERGFETTRTTSVNIDPHSAPSARGSIAVLDELVAFRDGDLGEEDGAGDAPQVQAERGATNDTQSPQMFKLFTRRGGQVDTELQNMATAVRPIGSSVSLISSTYHLRIRLQKVLQLFRENAANAFKDKAEFGAPELIRPFSSRKELEGRTQEPARFPRPNALVEVDLEIFPEQLELLAKDLESFLHALHDIPEFADEGLNSAVLSFEADLKYWAACLKEFEGQCKFPSIRRYVNDLTKEMGEHLEEFRDALRTFKGVGTSTIRISQSHAAAGLQNLSTVATIFSGVISITIQHSFDQAGGPLANAVNALWISSLVFSVASAINSQLAYNWRGTIYRSPHNAAPWWVSVWLTRTPLVFLVVSVMAFSAGLVCFTISQQEGIVQILFSVFTFFACFAMLAVSLCFRGEKRSVSKTKSSQWLADVIQEMTHKYYEAMVLNKWFGWVSIEYVSKAVNWNSTALPVAGAQRSSVLMKVTSIGEKTVVVPTTKPEMLLSMGTAPAHHIHFSSASNETPLGHPPTVASPHLPSTPTPNIGLAHFTPAQDSPPPGPPAREPPQNEMISPSAPSKGNGAPLGTTKELVRMQQPTTPVSSASPFTRRGFLSDRTAIPEDSLWQDPTHPPQFRPAIAHHDKRPAVDPLDQNITDDTVAEEIRDAHTIMIGPSPIARGGNADTYLGHWVPPGKPQKMRVAVKVLRLNGMSGTIEEAEQLARVDKRLGQEMRVWERLNHPRIVPLLGYLSSGNNIVDEDAPCLVSPFYTFRNMSYYLSHHPNTDRLVLLHQAAEGLNYLHTLTPPIIHLDLKPENVLINDREEAEICDFAVARILEETGTGLTASGNLGYTVNFASPEKLNGLQVTTAADVYSFGGLALETLSGKPPHYKMGRSQTQIVLAIANGKHPSKCDHTIQMRRDISDKLWGLLEQCWKTDPFQRPTMVTVMEKLREIRDLAMVSLP